MSYEVTLINANIRHAMDGEMRLGLVHDGTLAAEISYEWDAEKFTTCFHGHAPSMPVPAHPTAFIERPIAAINALKTDPKQLPTDVFENHRVFLDL